MNPSDSFIVRNLTSLPLRSSLLVFAALTGSVLNFAAYAKDKPEIAMIHEVEGNAQIIVEEGFRQNLLSHTYLYSGSTIELKADSTISGVQYIASKAKKTRWFSVIGPSTIKVQGNELVVQSGNSIQFEDRKTERKNPSHSTAVSGGFTMKSLEQSSEKSENPNSEKNR